MVTPAAACVPRRPRLTTLLYHTDSYLREFEAGVVSASPDDRSVEFDATAFYPGGGGQPCDFGSCTSGGATNPVVRVRKDGGSVIHVLAGAAPLPLPGDRVVGTLDWERRYALMRTHTAMHILCGVVFRDYGAPVTGGEMRPLGGRMDFEFSQMKGELVREIERAVKVGVAAAREVRAQTLGRDEAFQIPDLIRTKINLLPAGILHVRTIEIVGLDLQADGGTHVRNTSEVGPIRISDYKSKGTINKRIYIELQ